MLNTSNAILGVKGNGKKRKKLKSLPTPKPSFSMPEIETMMKNDIVALRLSLGCRQKRTKLTLLYFSFHSLKKATWLRFHFSFLFPGHIFSSSS